MRHIKLACLVFALSALLLGSCGKPPGPAEEIYWPKAPLAPKIQYVRTIYGNESLKRSFWGSIRDFFFGKGDRHSMWKPYGVTYDGRSKLFIADTAKKGILVLDLDKGTSKFFNSLGSQGYLAEPVYIKLDRDGLIYVSDTKLKRVVVFTPVYEFSHYIGSDEDFEGPVGIAFSKNEDRIFIVDSQGHKVKIFTKDGGFMDEFGHRGDKLGEFHYPLTVATNNGDSVYIVDSFHSSVQVFDIDGTFLFSFGSSESHPGPMARPRDIAIDSDNNIYITDAIRNAVHIYDNTGRVLLRFGQGGVEAGEFRLPAGISIDRDDYIYIGDSINKRVQVLRYLGQENSNN